MSLETLLEAARYIELQEIKQKQSTPPKAVNPTPQPPPINVSNTSLRVKQEPVMSASPTQIQMQTGPATQRVFRNSFDIINPLVIDEGGEVKRKQPPMVFRSGTREVHNKLEKHRRAHLKECFDLLKKQLPTTSDEKKTSNLNILHSAIKCIANLKKQEIELEHTMERLAREKIAYQQKLGLLKKDSSLCCDVEFGNLLPEVSAAADSTSIPSNIIQDGLVIKEEMDEGENNGMKVPDVQVSISNVLKLTKSITGAIPMVTTNSMNGVKDAVLPQTNQVQATALSVLPIGYQMNQGLVLQKVIMPKNITDFTQLVSNPPVAHFIATPQQLEGKVVPIVNAQYVVKPLVVVSTPSRPS